MTVTLTCLACGQGNRIPKDRLSNTAKCGKCGEPLISAMPAEISFVILKKAIRLDDLPLVVDFWAGWCGPCRMMAPEFAKASQALQGAARFAKLDTERYQMAGAHFAIRGIPLIIAFQGGYEIKRSTGVMQSAQIVDWLGDVG